MQIKFIVPGAAVVFAAFLNATVAFADGPQYVGPSATSQQGDVGYFALHDACSDTFRGSAMCTSQMIIEGGPASKAPSPGGGGEWVNPVFVFEEAGTGAVDFSGEVAGDAHTLNCEAWTSTSATGLQIRTLAGKVIFFVPTCSVGRPVACCK